MKAKELLELLKVMEEKNYVDFSELDVFVPYDCCDISEVVQAYIGEVGLILQTEHTLEEDPGFPEGSRFIDGFFLGRYDTIVNGKIVYHQPVLDFESF